MSATSTRPGRLSRRRRGSHSQALLTTTKHECDMNRPGTLATVTHRQPQAAALLTMISIGTRVTPQNRPKEATATQRKRDMNTKTRVTMSVLAASLAGVSTLAPGGGQASADPGFCGVGVSGPDHLSTTTNSYLLRNKCTGGLSLKIYLPRYGRYARPANSTTTNPCQWVPGGAYRTYWATLADPFWSIQVC